MSRVHRRQTAQKRRKKMGSSVAYKTRGTFLSQNMGHEDACGWATDQCKAVDAQRYANGQWPTLSFTHRTCNLPPPPPQEPPLPNIFERQMFGMRRGTGSIRPRSRVSLKANSTL